MRRSFGLALAATVALGGCRDFGKFDQLGDGGGGAPSNFGTVSYGLDALLGVWGSGPDDLYIVGTGSTLLHSSDGAHTLVQAGIGTDFDLRAVWGSGPADLYVVGPGGTIFHSTDGAIWSARPIDLQVQLNAIWGSGPADIYVVGADGTILHSTDGMAWSPQGAGVTHHDLNAVWGAGSSVWAASSAGEVLATTDGGATWTAQSIAADPLHAAWGSGAGDLYLGGDSALYHSSDGVTWAATPVGGPIYAFTGSASGDVYAVGAAGLMLHHGADPGWSRVVTPTTASLRAAWEGGAGTVIATGAGGTVLVPR